MSILDGPDIALAVPDVEAFDVDQNIMRRPGAAESAVPVRCYGEYKVHAESDAVGQSVTTTAFLLARSWPTGFAGRVVWDDREWDVEGEPVFRGRSGSGHWRVDLRARAPRLVA